MRIAVITETYPPEVNGVALTVHDLVARMAADGHELMLVRPHQPGVSALPLPQPIDELLVAGARLPKYPGLRFGFPAVEMPLCRVLNRWGSHGVVHELFAVVSRLGNGAFWYGLMLVLPLTDGWRGAVVSVQLAATGLVSLAIYRLLKRWTRRPRPYASHRGIIARVPPLDQFSFPSGHTLHAVAFTAITCAWYPAFAWILVPFSVLVALSRIVLGLHYPSDVAAAIVIGSLLAAGSIAAAGFMGAIPA
ncbi:MAG: phosphatase PAP2 family protein [Steroidobacteraceae bacterium]